MAKQVPWHASNARKHQYFPKMYQKTVVFKSFRPHSRTVGVIQVGVDESGRGSVIGPLVVCALGVPLEDREILSEIGADDSKKLSRKMRTKIHNEIVSLTKSRKWGLGVIICPPSRIDRVMQSDNLNYLEVELFAEAIWSADGDNLATEILLDACDINAERFGGAVSEKLGCNWTNCNFRSEHGMDSSDVLVGAASVVAKHVRDSEIEKISKSLGIDVGSGYPSDPRAQRAVIELCGEERPHDCLRWSWSTVVSAWNRQRRRPIPERFAVPGESSQSALDDWNQ